MDPMWTMLLVGFVFIIFGITGIGAKQRKNRWLVNIMGESGFKLFNIILGLIFIIIAFVLF